jgi:hypothetical protein
MHRAAIHTACVRQGYCVITEGSRHPGIVIGRLLSALRALAPLSAFDDALAVVSGAVSAEALDDDGHPDWDSPAADQALEDLVRAVNSYAPPGFALMPEGEWLRLGFFPC